MKIIKQESEFGLNVFVEEDNDKYLGFTFGGNGDLYWSLHKRSEDDNSIIITKENASLYNLFEKLYYDIENIRIYEDDDLIDKDKVREDVRYKLLFNKDDKTITWHSDETAYEVSNILEIHKEEDIYKVNFYIQNHIDGYDRDFYNSRYIPVRIRNSGSNYYPFNIVFMNMYNDIKKIDNIDDYGHQIHIDEYLYKENVRKLVQGGNNEYK